MISKIKADTGKNVAALVTDNEAKMVRFRTMISDKYPDILTYGCAAHYMNLLENQITDPDADVLNHVVSVSKHFRNVHNCLGLLRE